MTDDYTPAQRILATALLTAAAAIIGVAVVYGILALAFLVRGLS